MSDDKMKISLLVAAPLIAAGNIIFTVIGFYFFAHTDWFAWAGPAFSVSFTALVLLFVDLSDRLIEPKEKAEPWSAEFATGKRFILPQNKFDVYHHYPVD